MSMHKQNRAGYTLIELLVVITMVGILAGLTIAFWGPTSSSRVPTAASQLQSWLNIAKQRAVRDQAPRGLRLWLAQSVPDVAPPWDMARTYNVYETVSVAAPPYLYCCIQTNINAPPATSPAYWIPWRVATDCQYVEQPDDFSGGTIQSGLPPSPGPGYTVQNTIFMSADPTNGYGVAALPYKNDPNWIYWSVQPEDYLEVLATGLMHKILQVGVPSGGGIASNYLLISPPLTYPILQATGNYRIVRAPRAVGDTTLQLVSDTVIDLNTNPAFGNPLPTDPSGLFVDILFSPSGGVMSRGVTTANLNLWVRAPDAVAPADPYRGEPVIISVFVRTGAVAAFQRALPPAAPYSLVY